jgi:hypothetical protein
VTVRNPQQYGNKDRPMDTGAATRKLATINRDKTEWTVLMVRKWKNETAQVMKGEVKPCKLTRGEAISFFSSAAVHEMIPSPKLNAWLSDLEMIGRNPCRSYAFLKWFLKIYRENKSQLIMSHANSIGNMGSAGSRFGPPPAKDEVLIQPTTKMLKKRKRPIIKRFAQEYLELERQEEEKGGKDVDV